MKLSRFSLLLIRVVKVVWSMQEVCGATKTKGSVIEIHENFDQE